MASKMGSFKGFEKVISIWIYSILKYEVWFDVSLCLISKQKRKKTLLVEYKNQFKTNKFTDKRLGENDQNLSLEDKMFKRFVVERQVWLENLI